MRFGLIARADNTGLGNQTWEFYRHMHPSKTMVVDIGHLNGNKSYVERYGRGDGQNSYIKGFPTTWDIDRFLEGLDVVFVAESPYNYYLYERAKHLGIKVAMQYNYEFFDWFANPSYPTPDMLIAPSKWGYDTVQAFCDGRGIKHIYLHCPVNTDLLPARDIKQGLRFLHTAGKSAAHDRNGTELVIAASKLVHPNVQIKIHFQGEQGLGHQATHTIDDYRKLLAEAKPACNVVIEQKEYEDYQDVYSEADVLLLPRRYGGNCLPVNEALAVGMPVIMTDISPNNQFLPREWLVPSFRIGQFTPRMPVDIYGCDRIALAKKINEFAAYDEDAMRVHNNVAKGLGQQISWANLKPMYLKAFEELCTQ